MQEQDRRSGAGGSDVDRGVAEVDLVGAEIVQAPRVAGVYAFSSHNGSATPR